MVHTEHAQTGKLTQTWTTDLKNQGSNPSQLFSTQYESRGMTLIKKITGLVIKYLIVSCNSLAVRWHLHVTEVPLKFVLV